MTKKILVLHTGGTISMQADESGAVRTSADNPMNQWCRWLGSAVGCRSIRIRIGRTVGSSVRLTCI